MDGSNNLLPKKRLVSLDALRGFDMLWLIGAPIIRNSIDSLHFSGGKLLTGQLVHSAWNGFTFYDLIFPLFIFISGVSTVFSIQKQLENNVSRSPIFRRILKRTVLLFLLGIIYNGGVSQAPLWENIRIMGVLQRIALCYFFASVLLLTTTVKGQAVATGVILMGYWLLMRFVPVPGYGPGVWSFEGNLVRYVDELLLPGKLYWGSWDPEGILSTLPAIATCLMGVLTGHWLRSGFTKEITTCKKAVYLFLVGLGGVLAGSMANPIFPINKSMWTSSYVLLTGGLSAMLLAAFYWIIDIKGHQKWAFPFIVIGLNSIAIYLAVNIIPFASIVNRLVGGDISAWLGPGQELFKGAIQLALAWLFLYWLYRRKIFIKI